VKKEEEYAIFDQTLVEKQLETMVSDLEETLCIARDDIKILLSSHN